MHDAGRLADFEAHLRHEKGHSEHTVRAYCADVRSLVAFAGSRGVAIGDVDPARTDRASGSNRDGLRSRSQL